VKADLLAAPLCRDPLADIWRTVCQNNASPLALREKSNAFLPNQGYVFEVQDHVLPLTSAPITACSSAMSSLPIRPLNLKTTSSLADL
jgi:hypothetical protein